MAGRASLSNVICEANGKVKCTDISVPSTDFKTGKMNLLRLGNADSFSISIQQTVGQRLASKRTIRLRPHQFKLNTRPTKLTITFGYDKAALSIVEANESELKALVDLLNTINGGKFSDKEISSRPNQRIELSEKFQQNNSLANDENQPLNSNIQKNATSSVPSSEANQFLSTRPDHSTSPSRLEPAAHLGVKRKHTPFSSRSLSSSYGPRYSTPSVSVNKPFVSPLQEKSPKSDKSNMKTSSFYGTNSPATQGRKTIGLPKNYRQKPLLSSSFSFKPSVKKPVFAANEVQLTGFSNLGNTCYMNAILQSLLGIDSFAQDLCNRSLLDKIPTQCLYKCTYGLLACKKNNCQQDLQSLHLKKFKKTISQAATRFSGHLQHDAHEFLCQVLDQLKDDVNALLPKSDSDSAGESPVKEEISNQCPVRRTFECGVMHTITCKGCRESLNKEEIHHVFSLDLPTMSSDNVSQVMKKLSIDKLIEDYFEEEELEYCCEECGCKEAVISHTFSRLPRVLILHLKRYDFNTYTDKHAKKQNNIQINRFIDIGKLCNNKTTPPLDFKVEKVKISPVRTPRLAKRPQPDPQSDDDFVPSTTPKMRRKLHQEFSTPRKVQIIDDDPSTQNKDYPSDGNKEVKNGTGKQVEEPLIEDFDDIDSFSLEIETPKSDHTVNLLNMSEQQQIEWAKKESLKSTSSDTNQEDCFEQYDANIECKNTEGTSVCRNSSRNVARQSVLGKMDGSTGNSDGRITDMDGGATTINVNANNMDGIGDIDVHMDCSDEDLLTACEDTRQPDSINKDDDNTGNQEVRGFKGSARVQYKVSTDEDSHKQDNVGNEDEDTEDTGVHGLKGGARVGNTKVGSPVTYISDDSEHSGLDTKKPEKTSKTYYMNSGDSSDTSLDEGGIIKNRSKDNSLCSLMDRRPVLSKFSGDLLIESDSNDNTSRKNSRGFSKEKQFVKSVTSPFNAKFQPSISHGKSYSALASKYPIKSSPSSHSKRPSQTASEHNKSYSRREVQNYRTNVRRDVAQSDFDEEGTASRPIESYSRREVQNYRTNFKGDVAQLDFDEEEVAKAIQRSLDDQVPSSDDENVKKAIELSIRESRMDYSSDQQDYTNEERVPNVRQTLKTFSTHHEFQNNSIDSGYQGEEDPAVSFPYRLVSVVSHLGDKSFAGHYISEVYDCAKDEWTSYDDLSATKVDEHRVRYGRSREGYIFFYLYKQCVEAVKGRSPKSKT